jgi:hypothetical protein
VKKKTRVPLTRATAKKGVRVKTISRPDTADGRGERTGGC